MPHPTTPRRAFMQQLGLSLGALAAGLGANGVARDANAAPGNLPATLGSRQLQPGMKGYGLTVIRGQKVERFSVEVIGVLEHALPQQDMILIRCSGLNLEHSGVVAGMSGSPIFVTLPDGDKLVGALSYGFPFNKDPVAGVTPIADMLPELNRPLVPAPENQRLEPPAKRAAQGIQTPLGSELQPVAVPLVLSGFHPDVLAETRKDWTELGFPIVQLAAGGATKQKPSQPFAPGSAISLSLARGDMAISGIGTVTWVDGERFIAFGHPFKSLGQVHLPVGNAEIQWILSSLSSSFKMGNATADVGVLDQDRQPAIAGRIGTKATMVPIRVVVNSPDRKEKREWNVEATDQPMFFPLVAAAVVGNAFRVSEPIAENAAVEMKVTFHLPGGRPPLVLRETLTGLAGTAGLGEVSGLVGNVAKALTYNGFSRLRIEAIEAEFDVRDDRNLAFLEWVRVPGEVVQAGKPLRLQVGLVLPNKPGEQVIELTLPAVPHDFAGGELTVAVGPEKNLLPEMPEPKSVDDVIAFLRAQVPRSRLAAVVPLAEPTLLLRGKRLTRLPIFVRGEMEGHAVATKQGRDTLRVAVDTPWTLNGNAQIKVQVRP